MATLGRKISIITQNIDDLSLLARITFQCSDQAEWLRGAIDAYQVTVRQALEEKSIRAVERTDAIVQGALSPERAGPFTD